MPMTHPTRSTHPTTARPARFKKGLLAITCAALAMSAGCGGDSDGDTLITQHLTQLGQPQVKMAFLGRYQSGIFDDGAAEIVAFHPATQMVFVVNAAAGTVDVLDAADPGAPALHDTLEVAADVASAVTAINDASALGSANSVAIAGGLIAVAIEADIKQDNGYVAFYQAAGLTFLGAVEVGALPDMLTFTPDGKKVLVVNEGEPNDAYDNDPEGSVSIIDLAQGVAAATVSTVSFTDFNIGGAREAELPEAVRIFGPNATVAQDLEPEYITVSEDGRTAWVALQENNALARIDIDNATVEAIHALGFKNHRVPGNELDASDRDGGINLRHWPVWGMYQPDTIASYSVNGDTYIVTANEGDARDYGAFSEEYRVKDLPLGAAAFPDASLQDDDQLGRLRVTSTLGISNGCDPTADDPEVDCEYDALYAYGARSFAIWHEDGTLVYDSGSDFERITAQRAPAYFNATNDDNDSFDNRSDDKGPEPEALVLGELYGRTVAFIGLERIGGIMLYDISNPEAPQFMQYILNRDFTVDADDPAAGDIAPEGMAFVPASHSPNGQPLLIVGNEVSGTTAIYQIEKVD